MNAPHALRSHTPPPRHASRDDEQAFLKVFDQLRAELVQAEKDDAQVQIAVDWIDKMVEYNVPHGEGVSQLPFCSSPASLASPRTTESIHGTTSVFSLFHSFSLPRSLSRMSFSTCASTSTRASCTAVFLIHSCVSRPPATHSPTHPIIPGQTIKKNQNTSSRRERSRDRKPVQTRAQHRKREAPCHCDEVNNRRR